MLSSFSNWLTWTSKPKHEWDTWEVWQRSQPPSHYEKSDIFQYYLSFRPQFRASKNYDVYYTYCFGDFATFIFNPSLGDNVPDFCTLLLDFYDTCKGVSRRITGDPSGISTLREVVKKGSVIPLHAHDFNQYIYDYTLIHAHTVAQYSLSTLLMRLVANFMHNVSSYGDYPEIAIVECQKAYDNYCFGGRSRVSLTTAHININEPKSSSFPFDTSICSRCHVCNRVSENLWGTFNACLDCHTKRICSECSLTAVVISSDNLPKCSLHQNLFV